MSRKPIAILSDNHCHNWDAFSTILPSGVNSRLQHILDEIKNAAATVKAAGGDTLYFCGDLFHVRGSVSPMVLNPLIDVLIALAMDGVKCRILTGNHDLQSRDSEALSNACEALRCVPDIEIVSKPTVWWDDRIVMVPWFDKLDDLRNHIKVLKDLVENGDAAQGIMPGDASDYVLMIHAPVNGVLFGIPDHGFNAKELEVLGFEAVFSGHYHNHKVFPGNVVSVGATTHQTWNDVGTKTGHILYEDGVITHIDSKAPKFLDYDLGWDMAQAIEKAAGNFVRVKMGEATDEEIEFIRDHVLAIDAAGCLIQAIPVPKGTVTARAVSVAAAPTTRQSIHDWIKTALASDASLEAEVQDLASKILDEVESVAV